MKLNYSKAVNVSGFNGAASKENSVNRNKSISSSKDSCQIGSPKKMFKKTETPKREFRINYKNKNQSL